MIISRTPLRISFFGGGSDYKEWVDNEQGIVLSSTIDKYIYITLRELPKFFDHNYRIVYSKIESVKNINEIKHHAIKGILKNFNYKNGLEIHHDSDLPAKSGMGSSSAFVVGLLNSLNTLSKKTISKKNLSENEFIEENFFDKINYRKIKKKLIHDIVDARIEEISRKILSENINLVNYANKVKVNFLLIASLIKGDIFIISGLVPTTKAILYIISNIYAIAI